jgi:hypothetical protein
VSVFVFSWDTGEGCFYRRVAQHAAVRRLRTSQEKHVCLRPRYCKRQF